MQKIFKAGIAIIGTLIFGSAWGAQAVHLTNQAFSFVQNTLLTADFAPGQSQLNQISVEQDKNQTKHVRLRQTYQGYPVWGADVVVHYANRGKLSDSNTSVNGVVYKNVGMDLQKTDPIIFTSKQASSALQHAIQVYQNKTGIKNPVSETEVNLIVFINHENKARWAYKISFFAPEGRDNMPSKPVYIIDAHDFTLYQEWNDIQTLESALGGGFGGNIKTGKWIYDGLKGDLPALEIERDAAKKTCYLRNNKISVKDTRDKNAIVSFQCDARHSEHGNIYWNGETDAANGAYSPSNDAMYVGHIIQSLYQDWYGIPVLTQREKPMRLIMLVHQKMDNAYWDGKEMVFGDGVDLFFPLVSLGTAAHEVSHGFTQQHSNLVYFEQPGALNESFSDMAAQAAEFYAMGKNNWEIGSEVIKANNQALRYMDEPTKDCEGRMPGIDCSISHIKDYHEGVDPHFASGVFNKVFYLMSTSSGWNTKKAFDVMVQANRNYWTSISTFGEAACGVLKAAQDYHYETDSIKNAFSIVGINTQKC